MRSLLGILSLAACMLCGCVYDDELEIISDELQSEEKGKSRLDVLEEKQATSKEVTDWFAERPPLKDIPSADFARVREIPALSSRVTTVETDVADLKVKVQSLENTIHDEDRGVIATIGKIDTREDVKNLQSSIQELKEEGDPVEQLRKFAELNDLFGNSFGARFRLQVDPPQSDPRVIARLDRISGKIDLNRNMLEALLVRMTDSLQQAARLTATLAPLRGSWNQFEGFMKTAEIHFKEVTRDLDDIKVEQFTQDQVEARIETAVETMRAELKAQGKELKDVKDIVVGLEPDEKVLRVIPQEMKGTVVIFPEVMNANWCYNPGTQIIHCWTHKFPHPH